MKKLCLFLEDKRIIYTFTDDNATHKNINFPGHKHATIYNVLKIEPPVRKLIKDMGIEVRIMSRVADVDCEGKVLKAVILEDGERIERRIVLWSNLTEFISGAISENCSKYGNGVCHGGMCRNVRIFWRKSKYNW
ncbi:MAG: hypothetical protein ACLTDP_09670 [Terrisporobacter sp.]